MAIRKHPTKPTGWWQIIISRGRKKKQDVYTYQGTRAEALAFEADLRGIPAEASDQKLLDILGRFLDWYTINMAQRTCTEAEKTLPKIIGRLGNLHLSSIRQLHYDKYKQQRLADGVTKRTINIELNFLSSMLRYAQQQLGQVVGDYPKRYTKKQTQPPPKTPLSAAEIARLLDQLEGDIKTIVILYSWCGLRRSEALQLKRKNVDLQAGLMHISGKMDKNRIVPIIGQELHQRLASACKTKKNDEYLFINPATNRPYIDLKKSLKTAAQRAGITKPVWAHLLRHSGATAAIGAGVGLRELQDILGHSDIRTTEIYTHLNAKMTKTAGEKIAAFHQAAEQSKKQPSEMSETENVVNLSEYRKKKTGENN